MIEKVAAMKGFDYSPSDKELKAQTEVAKKQYIIVTIVFFKYYCDIKKFDNLSLKSNHSFLVEFFNNLN